MRRATLTEILRRVGSLTLFTAAAVALLASSEGPHGLIASGLAVCALALYIAVPWPKRPDDALRYDAIPAIFGPDLLGFLLGVLFFGLPFLIAGDAALGEGVVIVGGVLWAMGLFALAILWIAARHAVSWIVLKDTSVVIAGPRAIVELAYGDIVRVAPRAHRLPRWVGAALMLFGGIRGMGIALLHADRVSHALEFVPRTGRPIRVPADAFDDPRRLLATLAAEGVPLEGELAAIAAKAQRKAGRRRGA